MRRPPAPVAVTDGPDHGGRLNAAVRRWGIPRDRWLDLSTGINPNGWPVPAIPAEVWRRLPEDDDGLESVIRQWAHMPTGAACLPVAGSQAAIQALPRLRATCRVGVPAPGYREHGHCWATAGHEVVALSLEQLEDQLDKLDVVVWIQPNNPTGETVPLETLLGWQARLACRGGWLVVDEAFFDPRSSSLAIHADREGLIVLRSMGKFFGLAGLRAGAAIAAPALCEQLAHYLGPWALSGPARYIMARVLKDGAWQQITAERLEQDSARLERLLTRYRLPPSGATLLFCHVRHPAASTVSSELARHAVLVRLFDEPPGLRFGLPGSEPEWQQLEAALESIHTMGLI